MVINMIKGIEHTGLVARDAQTLAAWYCRVLRMKMVMKTAGGAIFLKAPGGGIIEIYACRTAGESGFDNYVSGLRHLAFEVEDFEAERRRLQDLGVEFAAAPVITDELKLVLFRDCEGNLCHFVERWQPLDYAHPT